MATTARDRTQLGAYGEATAARHLTTAEKMVLLDRNWRCELGEIDLVLRDGDTLVICEVKTRSSLRYGGPLEAVTPAKAGRLRSLAARWCEDQGLPLRGVRIDLVGVLLDRGRVARIDHLRGVG